MVNIFRIPIGEIKSGLSDAKAQRMLFLLTGAFSALAVFIVGLNIIPKTDSSDALDLVPLPFDRAIRNEPLSFPKNTFLPPVNEGTASGSIDLTTFNPDTDLTRIDDPRVWWESDNYPGDEDDHIIHKAMEHPMRRLIELVSAQGGRLKVQDTYRPTGVHNPRSLHKEGRALDVTCDELSMEKLASLCWAAGFDWVFHEHGKGGLHVHCSVRRDHSPIMVWDRPKLATAASE